MTQVLVSKWGNSLAVRLPKHLAEQLALVEGQALDISALGRQIVLEAPLATTYRKYDRAVLIAQIDPNDPPEAFDNPAVGWERL